jgi:hypothetical protein
VKCLRYLPRFYCGDTRISARAKNSDTEFHSLGLVTSVWLESSITESFLPKTWAHQNGSWVHFLLCVHKSLH